MHQFSLRRSTVAAGLAAASLLGFAATANATAEDDRFLAALANLDIHFSTTAEAIQTGHSVCQDFADGLAQGKDPADIRAGIISRLGELWLDGSQSANLMWVAVDVYCPQYNDAAGD